MQKRLRLIFPKKSDYPNSLKILDNPNQSAAYQQLIEAAASAYFETDKLTRWLFMQRFKTATKILNQLEPAEYLLDAGTGIGFYLPVLSQMAKKIYAIDNTDEPLNYAQKMCKKLHINNVVFKKTSIQTNSFFNNKFQIIVCLSVLEHIPPDNLPKVISNFYKILKPNGSLIAGFPNEGGKLFQLIKISEKKIFRRHILKALEDKTREQYDTLGHVASAQQIENCLKQKFQVKMIKRLPVRGIKLYSLSLYKKLN